ncbi:MAG TPA: phosphoenolpyruvate--protein phosphotransferase [Caldithrix abyssi]|uniref:Phosphoenolpyruvate-protein phosphotransferase n=1 Tax=Caldithrix abyssi TaxID=187145 RepID=A0A7V4WXB9_CALAY|nr:phosphoenolpyruvate--protein phosphotransferase [Caldithrix abyssi]
MKNRFPKKELKLHGTPTSPGIAIGPVYNFKPLTINLSELAIKIENVEAEFRHFENARRKVLAQLLYARQVSEEHYSNQFSDIFESQKAFLEDPVLIEEIREQIHQTHHSAAYVVSEILSEKSEHFIKQENEYFRERAYDILDLKQKLIHALLGISIDYHLTNPAIIVAEMLSPADTVQFNRNFILGFLTDQGGKTSHAAIMARGLRIPSVVNSAGLSRIIGKQDFLIIDGFEGSIILNPNPETREQYEKLQKKYRRHESSLTKQARKEARTKDGQKVELMANIEFIQEVSDVKLNYADGVGLFRTESIFIERETLPDEQDQFEIYKKVAEQLDPAELVIRTVDLGGDKLIKGYSAEEEANPFLGWRGIRFCLDRPMIFKQQLRAILRASAFGNVKILLPMISNMKEVQKTRDLIEQVKKELQQEGHAFNREIAVGIMIETPSAALMAAQLAPLADFFSIGTNDLTQYVLAIDRTNNRVAKSYNTFNPSVLRLIAETIQAADRNKIPVTLCGEFAAQPEAVPLLIGMGLFSFSMNPFSVPEIKQVVRAIKKDECGELYRDVAKLSDEQAIEKTCRQFLDKRVPPLNLSK